MANPFIHVELNTDDTTKAKKFYRGVFDWKLEDMEMGPGMVYTMIDVGKGVGGGIQKKPMSQAPNMWLSYVQVDSVKRTIAKAARRGAQIIVDYQPIPGMGALGIFLDPSGAALGVFEAKSATKKPATKSKAAAKKKTAKKPAAKRPARK